MITFPNAKINLGLNVVEKRKDGFHNIESIFYPIDLCDILEIIESPKFKFTSSGLNIPGDTTNNLCVKAYELLKKDFNIKNVKIHLHKVIPMGAGLGGGSADGAFCINMLNNIFNLRLSSQQKLNYAEKLGSDCPFFIENKPAFATGKGEILSRSTICLSNKWIAIINPNIHINTATAFKEVNPKPSNIDLKKIVNQPITEWKFSLNNDFEEPVFKAHPLLTELKEMLYNSGAEYASMTGTGSTIYGVFEKKPKLNHNSNYFTWISELP